MNHSRKGRRRPRHGAATLVRGRARQAQAAFANLRTAQPATVRGWTGEAQALLDLGNARGAKALLEEFYRTQPQHSCAMQVLARFLAACPCAEERDGAQALRLAQTLFNQGRTAERAEALAMALAEVGRFGDALKWERWALEQLGEHADPSLLRRHRMLLALYENKRPCRDLGWKPDGYSN